MPLVKPPRALSSVKCVKKVRDKNGDVRHDLKVLFEYVRRFLIFLHFYVLFVVSFDMFNLFYSQENPQWSLTTEEVLDLKELFMIFDTDQDGVLTFTQLKSVMGTLGIPIKGLFETKPITIILKFPFQ